MALEQRALVAGDEIGFADEIGRTEFVGAKTQMGNRYRAGFFGVIHEIPLGVEIGMLADDLDRVLVGADGAVGTDAEENGAQRFRRFGRVT